MSVAFELSLLSKPVFLCSPELPHKGAFAFFHLAVMQCLELPKTPLMVLRNLQHCLLHQALVPLHQY